MNSDRSRVKVETIVFVDQSVDVVTFRRLCSSFVGSLATEAMVDNDSTAVKSSVYRVMTTGQQIHNV